MKKQYLLIILFLCFYKNYGQEPMQDAYVSKTLTVVDEEWSEMNYSSMVNVSSNKRGQLKIANAEFLTELSGGKASMLEGSAYNSAEFTSQILTKEKTEKNGLVNLTFEGKLVFKTHDGVYAPSSKITFIMNQADIIALKIHNEENNKDYVLNLEIKE
jgi:hypothetical protein